MNNEKVVNNFRFGRAKSKSTVYGLSGNLATHRHRKELLRSLGFVEIC